MKHTPGPWAVGVYESTDAFRSIAQHACVCDPETLALIAVTGRADDRQSQVDADLIAAAPELLAACKSALTAMRQMRDGQPAAWAEMVTPEVATAWDSLKAAIAKATEECA